MNAETWARDAAMVRDRLLRITEAPANSIRVMSHEGVPVPWSRAGSFKGRRFTPAKLVKAERDLAYCLRGAVPDRPLLSNVAIVAIFFLKDRRRTDADNLMKTVLDAGNQAGIWHDDCQVTASAVFVEIDRQHPRTVVALCPTSSSLDRTVQTKKRTGALLEVGA